MSNGQKKRKYKRMEPETSKLFARFRVKQYEGREAVPHDWDTVILKNLSVGGALFFYNKDLGIDTLLDLKIDVSRSVPTISCIGKIIRINKPQSTSMFLIATKFIDIGEQEKELINKFVEQISE